MRQLKITNIKMPEHETDLIIGAYQNQADSKKIDPSLEIALLAEIRRGNSDAIAKLVDSWEHVIITAIESERRRQIDNRSVPIEKMFNAGRLALTALAERELDATGRGIFFRFGVWYVQQAMHKLVTTF